MTSLNNRREMQSAQFFSFFVLFVSSKINLHNEAIFQSKQWGAVRASKRRSGAHDLIVKFAVSPSGLTVFDPLSFIYVWKQMPLCSNGHYGEARFIFLLQTFGGVQPAVSHLHPQWMKKGHLNEWFSNSLAFSLNGSWRLT